MSSFESTPSPSDEGRHSASQRPSNRHREALNQLARFRSNRELFTHYYRTRHWQGGGEETVSGKGSTLTATKNIRKALPQLLRHRAIKSVLDAPCGDFNWFKAIRDQLEVDYIGADIVPELIQQNLPYAASHPRTRFVQLDVTHSKLPEVDLWLLRDCLIHFSFADVLRTIRNFQTSKIPYLLVTTHPEVSHNQNRPTGSWSPLNLERAPFNFPRPVEVIDDTIPGRPVKHLGLWPQNTLPDLDSQVQPTS